MSVAWYRTFPRAGKPYRSLLVISTVTHCLGYFSVISGIRISWGFSTVLSILKKNMLTLTINKIFVYIPILNDSDKFVGVVPRAYPLSIGKPKNNYAKAMQLCKSYANNLGLLYARFTACLHSILAIN
ncbi:MAG: hypothetical protein JGK21_05360 [Microcoleus sp. PH2017_22_RUC_O_B]|nr:hypothetical protein [Microcoleus sp. PH2017_21_RUC_O_A]MCC3539809.1 hypothetical protein [Microcoleus sp. PH2017_22_RUC_O_B]